MQRTRVLTLAITTVAVGLTTTLSGHHSFAAYYFEDQIVEIEGAVSQIEFKAPHVWLHVAARDDAGTPRAYAAEGANPTRLERDGITRDTLKVEETVHLWVSPSRDASDNRVHLRRIQRPSDGWQWGRALRR